MGCRESAGNSCENGSLSPAADRGTGSTGLSGRTHRFHLLGKCRAFLRKRFTFPRGRQGYRLTGLSGRTHRFHLLGKCREFLRFWFTFPRGSHGHRLHRPLWRHSPFPPPGKVPGFPAKTVHSSSRKDQALPPLRGGPLPLEPRAASLFSLLEFSFMSGHRFHRPLSRHLQFPPPGKVPRFPANSVHFPPCLVGPLPHSPLSPHLPSPPTGKVP